VKHVLYNFRLRSRVSVALYAPHVFARDCLFVNSPFQ